MEKSDVRFRNENVTLREIIKANNQLYGLYYVNCISNCIGLLYYYMI